MVQSVLEASTGREGQSDGETSKTPHDRNRRDLQPNNQRGERKELMRTMSMLRGSRGWLVLLLGLLGRPGAFAAPSATTAQPAAIAYEEPKLLVGNIFPLGAEPKKPLFKSQRTATRDGANVKVVCEYTATGGAAVARDRITYGAGKLVSFASDEFQTGEKGAAVLRADPSHPGQRTIFFEFTAAPGANAKKSAESERADMETLVDDMIPDFIVAHWDALAAGAPAKFRYIVLSRAETVGFKLSKESETTRQGKPVLRIKMEPTSFIIAKLVDPLYFIVEKGAPHRILQYLGRTTPVIKNGSKWKELDADTVFEWN